MFCLLNLSSQWGLKQVKLFKNMREECGRTLYMAMDEGQNFRNQGREVVVAAAFSTKPQDFRIITRRHSTKNHSAVIGYFSAHERLLLASAISCEEMIGDPNILNVTAPLFLNEYLSRQPKLVQRQFRREGLLELALDGCSDESKRMATALTYVLRNTIPNVRVVHYRKEIIRRTKCMVCPSLLCMADSAVYFLETHFFNLQPDGKTSPLRQVINGRSIPLASN